MDLFLDLWAFSLYGYRYHKTTVGTSQNKLISPNYPYPAGLAVGPADVAPPSATYQEALHCTSQWKDEGMEINKHALKQYKRDFTLKHKPGTVRTTHQYGNYLVRHLTKVFQGSHQETKLKQRSHAASGEMRTLQYSQKHTTEAKQEHRLKDKMINGN
ncbi:hypothetical protein E2C01_034724 [Portunus trituberculatus]|uniref:Uncharacterized protein n=1 Tax=Portunus trituberculatus TaxID=210409 RepID=A0A5B7F7D3_PORTR|nr:hypothetical protein [Portunus trituberculatus]